MAIIRWRAVSSLVIFSLCCVSMSCFRRFSLPFFILRASAPLRESCRTFLLLYVPG